MLFVELNHHILWPQQLDVDFFLYLYTLYEVKGRTVTPLLHKLFLGEFQVTILCVYPLNKQLHALSSALYQKFATFTVLLSFCFFLLSLIISMRWVQGYLCCFVCKYRSKCIASSDWSIHDDRMFSSSGPIR